MAAKNACDDWAKDNTLGSAVMTYDSFLESMFEMASILTRFETRIALDYRRQTTDETVHGSNWYAREVAEGDGGKLKA